MRSCNDHLGQRILLPGQTRGGSWLRSDPCLVADGPCLVEVGSLSGCGRTLSVCGRIPVRLRADPRPGSGHSRSIACGCWTGGGRVLVSDGLTWPAGSSAGHA
jgi:hypothetical protein